MLDSPDNTNSIEIDQSTVRELHDLCTRLYDQVISEKELKRFNDLLDSRRSARSFYLRYVSLHSMLLTSAGKQERIEAEALSRHVAVSAQTDQPEFPVFLARKQGSGVAADRFESRKSASFLWLAIVASLLVAITAVVWTVRSSHQIDSVAKNKHDSPSLRKEGLAEQTTPVARLSYVSPAIHWQGDMTIEQGSAVSSGSRLCLTEGDIELTYSSGSKLLLIGPADFHVDATGGKLCRGGLVAAITEGGHGFTVNTPNGKVVDLGTEFGVVVDDFGVSEVSVFQGKVEAFPQGSGSKQEKYELTKGRGLQWDQDKLVPLDSDLRRFASSVLDRSRQGTQSPGQEALVDRFRKSRLDPERWKSLGDVVPSDSGLQMLGSAAGNSRPYLIAANQLDPAQGSITITCDFRFSDLDPGDKPSFAILTRSEDQRGSAPEPWANTLASCVRSSFGFVADSGDDLLQTGVKLESDRELSGVSWSSFLKPMPDTPYRVVMRDDGVNVSFTVSLRDDSSTARTVTCRSLFRGMANYIALEGSSTGTTLIEHVEISQDRSTSPLTSYADFSSLILDGGEQRRLELQLLAELAPADATLVLRDDFASRDLDMNSWSSLGDVVVSSGGLQIGLPNAASHIDTWKPRPYLLTRKPLDPTAGTLTILGKITFSENFLAGYGASFAVMTRADNQLGRGPGWENSVLRRGVRANFWPAAWDTEHGLEIHEKPDVNTIRLLATQGFPVDPQTRSYLFRVIDDGDSIIMTVYDPSRTDTSETIASLASSSLREGFIGFESSWGSPVMLDDVRVYQSPRSAQNVSTTDDE
ncbi:FecR domain-containing protein [Bythopirellula goksoeyrii]|uniref:FecR protein n=1 Tax=Bythopirellula goksoeyrii TaxID=1400387 RepID=A0A5B9QC00_9BACT|nr:FecR domain-containing protein [Bythopirellula goksoeyrii]QEG36554.1 FecR protein [Bythopirellula goksoeyrii]